MRISLLMSVFDCLEVLTSYAEPERPKNAIDYVKKFLGAPTSVDIDGLRRENEELKRQLETVRKQSGTRE